jgi:ferredoxin-NADP reductase
VMGKRCVYKALRPAQVGALQPPENLIFTPKIMRSVRTVSPNFNTSTTQQRFMITSRCLVGQLPSRTFRNARCGQWLKLQPHRKFSSTPFQSLQTEAPSRRSSKTRSRWAIGGSILLVAVTTVALLRGVSQRSDKVFDPPRFTPFTVVKRDIVSPTSVILTVRRFPNGTEDSYRKMWERGIWSVEVKQPELQIARSYTPLPPIQPVEYSELRFLIRKEHKGEVSGYVHNLGLGSKIELRGPHPGFDIPENVAEVIFLAGGTGIAPALQAAYTTLEKRNRQARVRIVWSNRRREDCEGGGQTNSMGWKAEEETGLIVQELEYLQKKHPGQLTIEYLVDEEKTFLTPKKISKMLKAHGKGSVEGSKLLLVSGPEGFVNHFVGPKRWDGGKEIQGEVTGVIGKMRLPDWAVWKL